MDNENWEFFQVWYYFMIGIQEKALLLGLLTLSKGILIMLNEMLI